MFIILEDLALDEPEPIQEEETIEPIVEEDEEIDPPIIVPKKTSTF